MTDEPQTRLARPVTDSPRASDALRLALPPRCGSPDHDRLLEIEVGTPLGRSAVEALRLDVLRLARRYGVEVRNVRIEPVDRIEGE